MTVGQVVPVATEAYEITLRTRIGISVQAFDYLLSETITVPPLVTRLGLTASEVEPEAVVLRVRPLLSVSEVVPEAVALRVRPLLSVSEVVPEVINLRIRTRITVGGANPINGLSPIFLYDFSDSATLTTSGTEITGITDQGSLGWNLTKVGTGPSLADWGNGKNCADWGNPGHSNALRYVHTGSSQNIAQIFIVLDANFGSTFSSYSGLISGVNDDALDFAVTGGVNTRGFDGETNWFNYASLNGGSTNEITTVLPTINNRCVLMMRNVNSSASVLDDGIRLGNDRSNPNRGWGGLLGLVVGFSSVLNSTDEATVISYLTTEWNV
jgi:hypothetical protein